MRTHIRPGLHSQTTTSDICYSSADPHQLPKSPSSPPFTMSAGVSVRDKLIQTIDDIELISK